MPGTTITSNSAAGYYLGALVANPVTVASGVTISNTHAPALFSPLPTYRTIVNYGTLFATQPATVKYAFSDGILLKGGGGSVTNASDGSIGGYYVGVSIAASGTVVNQGTIVSTGTNGFGSSYQNGVFTSQSAGVLLGGGGISNAGSGVISGYFEGVALLGSGSVVNAGTILASSSPTIGYGAVLDAGGSLTNAQGGTIDGGVDGVLSFGQVSTVVNQGVVTGNADLGVGLVAGGVVTNASAGTIFGSGDGVKSFGTNALTVYNNQNGVISGGEIGVYAGAGSTGTLTNAGIIVGTAAAGVVMLAGGTIDNQAPGYIAGGQDAIFANGGAPSAVTNAGTLYGYRFAGAYLAGGGNVTNTGSISGKYFGVEINNATGSVLNMGSISDSVVFNGSPTFDSAGVQLARGGVVTNASGGTITSKWKGVEIGTRTAGVGGTVVNYGTIVAADPSGDGAGVWIHGPGAITNAAGGYIRGAADGVVAYYQTTLVNQGTISSDGNAFIAADSGFADRIIDLPGGLFYGTVNGGNALGSGVTSTLELASGTSAGTIADAGTFINFGQVALDAGATWSVGGSLAAGETVAFGGTDASLILATPSAAAATFADFALTDTIVLPGITDVTGLSFDGTNTLTVSETGGPGLTLDFVAPEDLNFSTLGGNTDLFVVPCFLPGTHIRTGRGEVLVEKLRVGDTIVTLSGRTRRLCWIGEGRALATRGRRSAATPVIVRKGALADNVPHLDLRITKGHSLYFEGVLIPVEFLVNHRTILWDDRAQEVTVYHLELDTHDVLVANGAAAESYRDDGNRWLFRNANAGWDQPPKPPCAPVLTGGEVVDAIWQRLLGRAGPRPGLPLTDDPELHLVVDGQRVEASEQDGLVWVFRLDRQPRSIRIASREAVPAELGLARDARSLGVALRRIAVRQGSKFIVLRPDDARLADGFHAYEAAGELRWTDGNATLPAELFARFAGGVEVVLHLAATTRYPAIGGRAGMAA